MISYHARFRLFAAVLLLALSVAAQMTYRRPSVDVSRGSYEYPQAVHSIRDVDFRNFSYVEFDKRKRAWRQMVELKNGDHQGDIEFGLPHDQSSLDSVQYFFPSYAQPFPPEPRISEFAVVEWSEFSCGGSCSNWKTVEVSKVFRDQLSVVQEFSFDLQAEGTGVLFETIRRDSGEGPYLTLRARSDDGSAHCCPKHLDIVGYKWDGERFKQISFRTIPIKGR